MPGEDYSRDNPELYNHQLLFVAHTSHSARLCINLRRIAAAKQVKNKRTRLKPFFQKTLEALFRNEACLAIDRLAFRWLKWHFALLPALGADCLVHFARTTVEAASTKVSFHFISPILFFWPEGLLAN